METELPFGALLDAANINGFADGVAGICARAPEFGDVGASDDGMTRGLLPERL
jgi:hypothetical protein